MTTYDLSLVGGIVMLLVALLSFFSASWQNRSRLNSMFTFLMAGGLLFFADAQTMGGMKAEDVTLAIKRVILAATG